MEIVLGPPLCCSFFTVIADSARCPARRRPANFRYPGQSSLALIVRSCVELILGAQPKLFRAWLPLQEGPLTVLRGPDFKIHRGTVPNHQICARGDLKSVRSWIATGSPLNLPPGQEDTSTKSAPGCHREELLKPRRSLVGEVPGGPPTLAKERPEKDPDQGGPQGYGRSGSARGG